MAARSAVDAADVHLLAPSEQDGRIDVHKVEDADEEQDGRRDAEYTHIAGIALTGLFIQINTKSGMKIEILHREKQIAEVVSPQFAVEELSIAFVEVVIVCTRTQAEQFI